MLPGDLFFFNDTATTEIYTLSLHDALPICSCWPTIRRGYADSIRIVPRDCGRSRMFSKRGDEAVLRFLAMHASCVGDADRQGRLGGSSRGLAGGGGPPGGW